MTANELQNQFDEAIDFFQLIEKLSSVKLAVTDDDYLNLNRAYFRICTNFYSSFISLIGSGNPFPAIVILRSILEIYTKGVYLEYIEKPKGTDVKALICGDKDFPSFFKMASDLDKYGKDEKNGLEGMFKQFTKQDLAQYEKFSLFTHGRGEFVQTFMKSDNVRLQPAPVSDLIQTARGLYETFSLFYFGLQKQADAYLKLRDKIQKSALYTKRDI
ncbi:MULTISPECIES: hypothetical protein [Enterobacteriaceae]|uniref:hypothetical protein n=1 Tax=Enterobacteriaceae TaxID=543 RepID=UPI000EE0C9B8|nr:MULTISPECIES: hypothetical protein [Enterobacteriaceae]MBR7585645.1 hypothetical protein [Klebsiella variicola]RJK53769.1 hypothetical protein CMV61_18650 [Escherichia coli]RJK63504.1 hypothetical protein CMV59_25850 [Escherichia coli]HEK8471056.1 hypothetical protein [Escherichia coli]HEK8486339.1 hypothetical protein [Escherichia coli]